MDSVMVGMVTFTVMVQKYIKMDGIMEISNTEKPGMDGIMEISRMDYKMEISNMGAAGTDGITVKSRMDYKMETSAMDVKMEISIIGRMVS